MCTYHHWEPKPNRYRLLCGFDELWWQQYDLWTLHWWYPVSHHQLQNPRRLLLHPVLVCYFSSAGLFQGKIVAFVRHSSYRHFQPLNKHFNLVIIIVKSLTNNAKFKADEFNLGSPASLPWPSLGVLADIYQEPENEKIIWLMIIIFLILKE